MQKSIQDIVRPCQTDIYVYWCIKSDILMRKCNKPDCVDFLFFLQHNISVQKESDLTLTVMPSGVVYTCRLVHPAWHGLKYVLWSWPHTGWYPA